MSLLNWMDAERVGGYSTNGHMCIWCGRRYPEAYFRQSIDVCGPCESFRERHYHDVGNFFMRTVDGVQFRVYVPIDPIMTEDQIDTELLKLIKGPV